VTETRRPAVIRFAKPLIFLLCLVPLGLIAWDGFHGGLGAEPIREIQLRTGWWALSFLLLALSVTPLRKLTGLNQLIKLRRMLGLYGFLYAVLHFTNYVAVDQFFAWSEIVADILKRPWITVGFTALILLIPLALTSTQRMVRRLGKRWAPLHRLAYVAAALGVLHFLWLVKKDTREPATFGVVLIALLAVRLHLQRRASRLPQASPKPSSPPQVTTSTAA
jgi:sulfoxide reductase heme-binding subunit YedZ